MTSNDEKHTHQQCIENALAQIDRMVAEGHANYVTVGVALAAEVRRLRASNLEFADDEMSTVKELQQLRTKLARVEALPAKWRKDWDGEPGDVARQCALELEAALRG